MVIVIIVVIIIVVIINIVNIYIIVVTVIIISVVIIIIIIINSSVMTNYEIAPPTVLSCMCDVAFKRTLAANKKAAHIVATAGFLYRYLQARTCKCSGVRLYIVVTVIIISVVIIISIIINSSVMTHYFRKVAFVPHLKYVKKKGLKALNIF